MRRAFTLMELLIVIVLIGMLVGLALSALSGAAENAREDRTRSIIAKLDSFLGEKWDGYRTRSVPIRIGAGNTPRQSALIRLNALRELQRMELPDRKSDIANGNALQTNAVPFLTNSSLQRQYHRKALAATGGDLTKWTESHEGAECLYLIVSAMQDGDKNALDSFTADEIGDYDGDGMREIHDGWGRPIEFLRWAPGYRVDTVGLLATQDLATPDPFDPMKIDARWADASTTNNPFALRPLIYSAGRDHGYDVAAYIPAQPPPFLYRATSPPNDPYHVPTFPGAVIAGSVGDIDLDGYISWGDNITNHSQAVP
jgi:prepilin-type N-terminal cleavage/methylation domain-containing protein